MDFYISSAAWEAAAASAAATAATAAAQTATCGYLTDTPQRVLLLYNCKELRNVTAKRLDVKRGNLETCNVKLASQQQQQQY